jgi:hypothetical protein
MDDDLAKSAFGWAYILSRYLLLGRTDQSGTGKLMSEHHQKAARMLVGLLDGAMKAGVGNDGSVRLLALRYMIGFLSNPRFIKSYDMIRKGGSSGAYCSQKVVEYIRLAEKEESNGMPRSIVSMAKARVILHDAAAEKFDTNARSRHLQSALSHYAEILEKLASPRDAGIMDGEVVAWVLPEIYYALDQLSTCCPGDEGYWSSVQKSILLLGEVQFGVYYNPEEEMKRIDKGLRLAVGA